MNRGKSQWFSVWLACVILASHASADLATQQTLLQEPWWEIHHGDRSGFLSTVDSHRLFCLQRYIPVFAV